MSLIQKVQKRLAMYAGPDNILAKCEAQLIARSGDVTLAVGQFLKMARPQEAFELIEKHELYHVMADEV